VLYFCTFSNKLDLLEATCFITTKQLHLRNKPLSFFIRESVVGTEVVGPDETFFPGPVLGGCTDIPILDVRKKLHRDHETLERPRQARESPGEINPVP
jgi:hypothetical protein